MKIKSGCTATTLDFYYDLFVQSNLMPEEMLSDPADIIAVLNAIKVINDFERSCEEQIEDFYN